MYFDAPKCAPTNDLYIKDDNLRRSSALESLNHAFEKEVSCFSDSLREMENVIERLSGERLPFSDEVSHKDTPSNGSQLARIDSAAKALSFNNRRLEQLTKYLSSLV